MKNGLLIWNILLTLGIGYLLINQFTGKKVSPAAKAEASAQDPKAGKEFRIAYFIMDSIENNFDMVKDVKNEINKKDEEYGNEAQKLEYRYNKRLEEYQQKLPGMTQEQQKEEVNRIQQFQNQLRGEKQDLDNKYQDFVMRKNLSVKKKIEDFLAEYNQTHNYSYIVSYEQGLFYYKDSVYNITNDLIQGLNGLYKKEKQ